MRSQEVDDEHTAVDLRQMRHEEVQNALRDGSIDIGLVTLLPGDDTHPDLVATELVNGRPVALLPADHALAAEPVLTPRLLDNQPMITLYSDNMTFHELTKRFDAAKKRMNVRLQTRFFIPALRFVERGLGVCVMDPISVVGYRSYANPGRIVFRPFEPAVPFRVGIIYPPNSPRSRITNAFAEQLRLRMSALERASTTGADW